MKNVLVVNSSGHIGGAEKILVTFLADLDKGMYRLSTLLPSHGGLWDLLHREGMKREVIEGLYDKGFVTRADSIFKKPILTITSASSLFKFSNKICEYIKRHDTDIVVSCGVKASIASGISARRCAKACIWFIQDMLPANLFRSVFFLCARIFPNKIIVISKAIKNTFPKSLHNKIEVIYPFLGRKEVERAQSRRSLRKKLNINDDEVVLGVIGKIFRPKGIDIFLKAFSELKEDREKIKAIVAGDAEFETADPGYRDELEKMAKALHIEDSVIFLDWQDDIYDLLETMDIFVYTPTRPYGFGRVLIEAMLSSKAITAFGHSDVREIIEPGVSGLLVEPLDRKALVTELKELISDRSKREDLGRSAGVRFKERFSKDASRNRLNEILKEIRILLIIFFYLLEIYL